MIDGSGSIGSTPFNVIVSQVYSFIQLLSLDTGGAGSSDKVRVGIQVFNQGATALNQLNQFVIPTPPYSFPSGGTNVAGAIT